MAVSTTSFTKAPYAIPKALFATAIWFGLITGILEGACLLFFQRINWVQWARMIHVSWPILWISPLVAAICFTLIALAFWPVTFLIPKITPVRLLPFILLFLSIYDLLIRTARLHRL